MRDNAFGEFLPAAGHGYAQIPQVVSSLLKGEGDGPLIAVAANTEKGLETRVVDVRAEAPDAFAPRNVVKRRITDQASFIQELARRPLVDGISTVWANQKVGTVTAVYNDLGQAGEPYTARDDRLELVFIRNIDWTTLLTTVDGALHSQNDFGDLIENAGHLITSHPAAELMEIVDSIRASSSGAFESRINRANGSQTLGYSEEVSASAGRNGQLEVPRTITFEASPFEDYPAIEVRAQLRLRVTGGKLGLGLFPEPYEHRVRASWLDVTGDLSEAIAAPIYAANF